MISRIPFILCSLLGREASSTSAEYQSIDPEWTLVSDNDQMVAFLKVDHNWKHINRGSLSYEAESSDENATKYNISVDLVLLDFVKR